MKTNQTIKGMLLCITLILLLLSFGASAQEPGSSAINLDITERDASNYDIEWEWSGSPPERLIIVYNQFEENPTLPEDGQSYSAGSTFGSGKVLYDVPAVASDGVTPFAGINFSKSLLSDGGSDYWFTIYPYNTSGGNDYKTSNANPFAFVTPGLVEEPYMQASNGSHTVGESDGSKRTVSFSYDLSLDELDFPYESRYLVVYKVDSEITYEPVDGSPNVTNDFELRALSDGSKGRLDNEVETINVDVTGEEQILYVKIFAFNRANFDQTVGGNWASYNYLTFEPLEFSAIIPAEENNAPSVSDATFMVDENSEDGTSVGQVSATDSEDDPLSYSITDGNTSSVFSIDASGNISTSNQSALDFETGNQYVLTVNVSDGTQSVNATITININDINEAPTANDIVFSINENSINGTILGQIVSSDPESDQLVFSISNGNTNSAFAIDVSGNLSVNNQTELDFETKTQFVLTVTASDGALSNDATVTVNVNNVNEAPTVSGATFTVDENSNNGTSVGQVSSSDPESDALTLSFISGNTNNAFSIDNSGNILVSNETELDFETSPQFELSVHASDGTLSGNGTVTINLNDLSENAGPSISDQSFTIIESIENGNEVGTIEATDDQGDPITFAITSGNSNNAFSLASETGILIIMDRSALSFVPGATSTLTVTADDKVDSNSAIITIIHNNAPSFTWTNTTQNVAENDNWSLSIPANDPEGDDLTFTLNSMSVEGLIQISADGLSLEPISESGIDYEINPSIEFTLKATDALNNETISETITIDISNLNDNAPEADDQTISIAKSTPHNTIIATIVGTDLDGDMLTYSVKSGNTNDAFNINSTSGEVLVSSSTALSSNSSFSLVIDVSDGLFTSSVSLNINVAENTNPVIADQVFELEENSANGTAVGKVIAEDSDNDALTFSIISGNTDDAFLIVGSTGELLVINSEALDFETNPSFSLIVSVSDGKVTEVATISINLTDVDETVLGVYESRKMINLYPNPAADYISIDQNGRVKQVEIYDINGRIVESMERALDNRYHVSHLQPGSYFIFIETADASIKSRLVIK